jgi:UV DNA damage endonuclease
MQLGFAVKILGQPGLKSNDTRRWQNKPHLSVSLAYLRDIFVYLAQIDVHMYRMSSDLAPYLTHPDLSQFHQQIDECAHELAVVGQLARQQKLRLSFHPAAYVVLNSADESVSLKAIADLDAQARMLDIMALGPEAVVVTHVGGAHGGKGAAIGRFVDGYYRLSPAARRRLVLENDERAFTIQDTYTIHRQTGIRLVFDQLHHQCNPVPGMMVSEALDLALSTWPAGQTPKIHFSTPMTAMIVSEQRTDSGSKTHVLREPRLSQHADLIDPFSFIALLETIDVHRDFDVMLECKAKDLALLRLRGHLRQLAPELIDRYHIA